MSSPGDNHAFCYGDARFDSAHLFLGPADGWAVEMPAEQTHFAISLDRGQLFWPKLGEDMDATRVLLEWLPAQLRH